MLQAIAIVSELLLYLIPIIILLRDFYYIYKIKRVAQAQYYLTLYVLPIVVIALSIKGVLTFKNLSENIFLYAIDLVLIFFLIAFAYILVKDIIRRVPDEKVSLTLTDFAVPLVSLIPTFWHRSFPNWFDFFTYCAIGVVVVFIGLFFAKFSRRFRMYAVFAVIIVYFNAFAFAILGANLVRSYYGTIFLSLSGMVVLAIVIREANLFTQDNIAPVEILEEVHRWHLKTMLKALTVAIVVSVLSVVAVASSTVYIVAVHNKAKSDLLQNIFQESNMVMDNSKNILMNLGSAVKLASLKIASPNNPDVLEKAMSSVFNLYQNDFYYFDVVNTKGIVIEAYPWKSSIGDFILNYGYAEHILLTHLPTISKPISMQHGFNTIFLCYPIYVNGEFSGFVEGAVNINVFKRAFVMLGEEGIISHINTILYENGIVLSSSGEVPPLSRVSNFYIKLLSGKQVFYKKVSFEYLNGKFGVISYAPKDALVHFTNRVIWHTGIALFLVLFALFYVMYLVMSMLRSVDFHLGEAVEHAIHREEEARKSAVDVSQRLMKLTEFVNTVSFDQPDKTFYDNLLDVAIKVIPSAQKGSIAIKRGDYLEFVASHGFPLNRLKQVRLPFEKQKFFMRNKITVINEIRKLDKKIYSYSELKDIAEAGHLGEIKSTLSAAIYSEGEYVGSIFIDNMEKENAFTADDIKIAEAMSNVASMFVQGKHYINRIKQTLKADAIVISLMGELRNKKVHDSIILPVFKSLRGEISADIVGAGVITHSVTGLLKLCATEKVHSEVPVEKLKINTAKPAFVNPNDLDDVFWANNVKSVYFVPDKKLTGEGMCVGFSKPVEKVSKDVLELLNVLLPSVHDLVSNVELSKELSRVYIELLISMIHSIELKDPYTRNHSERVTVFAYLLGKRYGLSMRELRTLYYAAMLHDIGKVGIPDEILKKQGSLSEEEFAVIKRHPQIGANMIMDVTFLKESAYVVLFHHEHYDGSGYPAHLKGDQIPLLSRIISIVDAFDAMITERPYKKAYSIDDAIEYLRKGRGTHFDPKLTDLFIEMLETEREKFEEIIRKPDVMSIYEELFEI